MLIAHFVVATREERDTELARALVTAKIEAAATGKHGVLITRHDFSRFSVSLSQTVPYGIIHERDYAQADVSRQPFGVKDPANAADIMRNDMSATNAPSTKSPAKLPTPWRPVDDWSTLKDHHVEIHIGGKSIDQGRVDDVTADGAVLWP